MKPDYKLCFEKGGFEPYAHIQQENIECEVDSDDINLKSFRVKNHLEDNIWDGDELNLRVRDKLMEIADDFWESCNITWVKPKTVVLTGSICNFNWSSFSDIDVHVVVDFSEIHERKDFVQEYFDEKKNDWNNAHDNLNIFGYPVELYVEDVDAETESNGIYDLWKNEWVKKPDDIESIGLNKYAIKDIASRIMTKIDDMSDKFNSTEDSYELEKLNEKIVSLRKHIKEMRKEGLKHGEMGMLNIVYKVIKRSGYMDKLRDLNHEIYDKINSLNENKSFEANIRKIF